MNYEERLSQWAAEKAKTDEVEHLTVEFYLEEGMSYGCCHSEPAEMRVDVYHNKLLRKNRKPVLVYSQDLRYDMEGFLRELFDIG